MRKDEPMSFDEIKVSLRKAIKKISKENLINYFKSSLRKTQKDIENTKSRYKKTPKKYKK
jgi:hypothetical protein